MTAPKLLDARHGRVLEVDEAPKPVSYLLEGVVVDSGTSAIALPTQALRTACGVDIVRGVLGPAGGSVLGRSTNRTLSSVVVVATSEHVASTYRGNARGDSRVVVAVVRPWDTSDENYWSALRDFTESAELVVIDTVQHLASGNLLIAHAHGLEGLTPPVVGIYAGNETRAGIGGDVGWSFAERRLWLNQKTGLLEPQDSDDAPWNPQLSGYAAIRAQALAAAGEIRADQVRALGELARGVSRRGDPGIAVIVGQLLGGSWEDVARICGSNVTSTEIIQAIDKHGGEWESGLRSNPWATSSGSPAADDEPPF